MKETSRSAPLFLVILNTLLSTMPLALTVIRVIAGVRLLSLCAWQAPGILAMTPVSKSIKVASIMVKDEVKRLFIEQRMN